MLTYAASVVVMLVRLRDNVAVDDWPTIDDVLGTGISSCSTYPSACLLPPTVVNAR